MVSSLEANRIIQFGFIDVVLNWSIQRFVLVNLEPTIGSEIKKTRPCVIISPNEMNRNLRTITIAPMATKSRNLPTRVKIKHNNKIGWVVIDQLRTIDKARVIKVLGVLSEKATTQCKEVIRQAFVD